MSQDLRDKWDARYRDAAVNEDHAASVVLTHAALLPTTGLALDLACGLGANALYLARAGLQVEAFDLSPIAVEKLNAYAQSHGLAVVAAVRDVCAEPLAAEQYDVIVVSHFLDRTLCATIAAALRPGGLLFYQTFGPHGPGPANPDFRLRSGELPRLFAGMEVVVYREDEEAQLVARRPA